jgi:hypothetical protein
MPAGTFTELSFNASFFLNDDTGLLRATQSLEAVLRGGGETHKAKATVAFDLAAVGWVAEANGRRHLVTSLHGAPQGSFSGLGRRESA